MVSMTINRRDKFRVKTTSFKVALRFRIATTIKNSIHVFFFFSIMVVRVYKNINYIWHSQSNVHYLTLFEFLSQRD